MRLKKLQLVGFKSFADKTQLTFDEGITAIVGPNGCGKSNIADAFRWVLGEQSAKSMRGSKMPDIIFAGASGRPPLNFAEVSITLTDIQGALPIDYEEITVTRRLHRSGESEYFLNNQPVRLKDLHSLFLDSGIGKDSFSIFEQGKIDQVINYSPLERRYIFEEAAGIVRFLQRKRETMRKLEQADGNIVRVKDIHREVEQQVAVLREQAAKAQEFKELKSTMEKQEKELLVAKIRQIDKRKEEAQQQADEMSKVLTGISDAVGALEQQKGSCKADLESLEKALKLKSEELYQIRSDKALKIREKASAEEQLNAAIAKEKRWKNELETVFEQREHRAVELSKAKKQLKASETDISSLESALNGQREQVAALEAEVNKLHQDQRKAQQELLGVHQRESQLDSELKQNRVRLENSTERQTQLHERKTRLQTLEAELALQYQEKQKRVQEGNQAIDRQREMLHALDDKVQEANSRINTQKAERDLVQLQCNEHQARLKALLRLRADFEGFSVASKRLLQESANPQSVLYGKLKGLYELIFPQETALDAVASALGRYTETLVVQTKECAEAVAAFAKSEQLTDFSIVIQELLPPKEPLKGLPQEGVKPLLAQVAPSALAEHFLGDVVVADTADLALKQLKAGFLAEVWCPERLFVDRRAVFFYGSQSQNNAFMREAEIKALEIEVEKLQAQCRDYESKLAQLQQERSHLHSEMVELDKAIRRREMEMVEATFALQRLTADREKNKKETEHTDAELALLQQAIEKHQQTLGELEKSYLEAQHLTRQGKEKVAVIESTVQQKEAALKEQKNLLKEVDASCHGAAELMRRSQQTIQVIEIKESESVRQEQRLQEEIQMGRDFQAQLSLKCRECETLLADIELLLKKAGDACQEIDQAMTKQKAEVAELEKSLANILQSGKKQEHEQHQVALLIAQLTAAQEGLIQELQERYGLSFKAALDQVALTERSIDSMERKLRELRRKSEDSGDINMTAIEECAKHQVRYEFLNQQIGDLETSKEGLLQIITELEGESRKLFKETFAVISANFKKNFAILFNGGEADLQFTETSDLLEAGIEIIAKPPGKQMRSISLLSGGEKCLTAMALLFAIFEVKAGPFCILDEIDAPLDDSNVERFANVVKQFIDRCQFIIITHNKQTMAIADRLFGVSMEERGISKLLQMELSYAAIYTERNS